MSPHKVHAGQVGIDTPLVRELLAGQFPQWAELPLEPAGSRGSVNAVYRLGTDLSVRLPLRPAITDEVRREQAKLAALAPFLPVAIPAVEASGSPTDAFPGEWSVHRWLTGTNPCPGALADPRRLAADLVAFVGAFRRSDLPDRPPAYSGERRTRASMVSMDSSTRTVIGELEGLIDTRAALASWEESLAAPYDGREAAPARRSILIMSADKDMYQLVTDRVLVLNTAMRPGHRIIGPKQIEARYGLPPSAWCCRTGLAGDPADGIKGIPGIGPKTAARLLHGGLHLEDLPASGRLTGKTGQRVLGNFATAIKCRDLARMRTDIPVPSTPAGRHPNSPLPPT